ncbi:hypothetical protein C5167_026218 [Papaver somniferum]|nr:hypothetical protein C5167_026218 [Papaver somniferum]
MSQQDPDHLSEEEYKEDGQHYMMEIC